MEVDIDSDDEKRRKGNKVSTPDRSDGVLL